MSKDIVVRKGANIKLKGEASQEFANELNPVGVFSVMPEDLYGVVPKLLVKEGDAVKAGEPIFYFKGDDRVKVVSPVSGQVSAIVRGAKRKLLSIDITAESTQSYHKTEVGDVSSLDAEAIKSLMLDNGLWPFVKKRPYDVVANPDQKPKAIFISTFDSAPLSPDMGFALKGKGKEFQMGVDVLGKLTEGEVALNIDRKANNTFFQSIKNVELNTFSGKHPFGNVGVQIHHLNPVNKGEVVWVVSPQDVAIIGEFFMTGEYRADRVVALTGAQVEKPVYLNLVQGQNLTEVLNGKLKGDNNRVISGNVFTGNAVGAQGSLGFYDNHITVIKEGNHHAPFGWFPFSRPSKVSFSGVSFAGLSSKAFEVDSNINGEERPFVLTGKYDRFIPMEVLPIQLLKAILAEDIETMESLGIYEVAPEDFALAEFSCASKIDLQKIVRQGLDLMIRETE